MASMFAVLMPGVVSEPAHGVFRPLRVTRAPTKRVELREGDYLRAGRQLGREREGSEAQRQGGRQTGQGGGQFWSWNWGGSWTKALHATWGCAKRLSGAIRVAAVVEASHFVHHTTCNTTRGHCPALIFTYCVERPGTRVTIHLPVFCWCAQFLQTTLSGLHTAYNAIQSLSSALPSLPPSLPAWPWCLPPRTRRASFLPVQPVHARVTRS